MSPARLRRIAIVSCRVCFGLTCPAVIFEVALLCEELVFGQRAWVLGLGVGTLIGAAVGVMRLWLGKPSTVWSGWLPQI